MKITIVTHYVAPGDGQGRVNYEIVRRALEKGHTVYLVANTIAENLKSHPQVRWISISYGGLPSALIRNLVFSFGAWKAMKKLRQETDIINVNGAITFGRSDVNAVHFVHGGWRASPYYAPGSGLKGLYQRLFTSLNAFLEVRAFKKADVIVPVSQRVASELEVLGVPSQKLKPILNGVDLTLFSPGENKPLQREGVRLRCLFVGDIATYRKNLDTVLKAMIQSPNVHLTVVGRLDKSPFPALAQQLGVSDRVTFLGFRKDIPDLMRQADVFVFPSRYEACSLVLMEALSSGLPVVTAVTAGGAEVITPGSGYVMGDPNDAEALATILNDLAQDPAKVSDMSKMARQLALNYSWNIMADQYLGLYEACIAARPHHAA